MLDIVPATDDHLPYVYSTWIRSYRQSPYALSLGPDYPRRQRHRIDAILQHADALLLVDPQDWICGWVVGSVYPDEIIADYVYVRSLWRRQGHATQLLAALAGDCPSPRYYSHTTRDGRRLASALGWQPHPILAHRRPDQHAHRPD